MLPASFSTAAIFPVAAVLLFGIAVLCKKVLLGEPSNLASRKPPFKAFASYALGWGLVGAMAVTGRPFPKDNIR